MARNPRDIDERLREVIGRPSREESEAPSSDGRDRDSKLQVHVYAPPRSKAPVPPPEKEHAVKALLNNDWVKLIAAFVLGGAGGEAQDVVRGQDRSPQDERRIVKLEQAQATMRTDLRSVEKEGLATRKELYALGRFSFYVLKQQGVRVYLKDGVEMPDELEFGPAPLKVKLPPAVQPNESFPLPGRP